MIQKTEKFQAILIQDHPQTVLSNNILPSQGLCSESAAEVPNKPFNANFYLNSLILDLAHSFFGEKVFKCLLFQMGMSISKCYMHKTLSFRQLCAFIGEKHWVPSLPVQAIFFDS